MRYAWNYEAERERFPYVLRVPVRAAMAGFRRWDKRVARRVTHFIANSNAVAGRIRDSYGRPASVVHPPVDTAYFSAGGQRLGYFLYVGRLVQYKRPDLLVDAFAELPDQELRIAGAGPMLDKLRARATPNVRFAVSPEKTELRDLYRGASALVQAGEEDFGITMAEAQSCGTPVIALGRGGALDVVTDGETGLTFDAPTPTAVRSAIRRAHAMSWDFDHIATSASRFSHRAFRTRMHDEISRVVATRKDGQ
jgi:glycosyltransferase involved in cell wall biosynthesis